jgi:hypothetical protein
MTQEKVDKRVAWLQYLNTGLLTLILGFAMMISSTVATLNKRQSDSEKEDLRLKTIQDMNVKNVDELYKRVTTLEVKYIEDIKGWVEFNYIRKPQSK